MPGIVIQLCHYFKDCLTSLWLQMGSEREPPSDTLQQTAV